MQLMIGRAKRALGSSPMNSIFVPMKSPTKQSLIETVGITDVGVFIEASSGFSQTDDSIHCHHGIMSAEVWSLFAFSFTCIFNLLHVYQHPDA